MSLRGLCVSLMAALSTAACQTPPSTPEKESKFQVVTDPNGCTYVKSADDPPNKSYPCRTRDGTPTPK